MAALFRSADMKLEPTELPAPGGPWGGDSACKEETTALGLCAPCMLAGDCR